MIWNIIATKLMLCHRLSLKLVLVYGHKFSGQATFIIKGQSHLLEDINHLEELERLRLLFNQLEERQNLANVIDAAIIADGVQIFIGSENPLFKFSGCTMIVAPYHDSQEKVIGAIGILGPCHLNYGRIIPMVDYTAQILTRFIR